MCKRERNSACALTFFEVLIVLALLGLLAVMLLPALHRPQAKAKRTTCTTNLRAVGLFFLEWSMDHEDRFPMRVSVTNGGTKEVINSGNASVHFLVLSNFILNPTHPLNSPKVLFCPADSRRTAAKSFSQAFDNSNVSYFVGVDADKSKPQMFLTGDRNLTNHSGQRPGLLALTTNDSVGWTQDLHNKSGNVGLADGSVQQVTRNGLVNALRYSGTATNRLAIP